MDEIVDIIQKLKSRQQELEVQNNDLLLQLEAMRREVAEFRKEQETARLFMSAIDHASESIFFTDVKGHILYVNQSFERTSGYTRDELLGQTPRILKSGKHPQSFYKEMWATLLRGEIYRSRLINKHKSGSFYDEEASIAPIRNAAGKIINFISVKTNITPLLDVQRALEASNAELSRSNSELEQFAYVASHDLQEPLRSVSSCLQLLKKRYAGNLDERADEFIAHAVAGSQRMRELIDDLLTLSRVDSATINLISTDSAAVFEQVRANLAHSIEESGALLTHDELPTVNASPLMLAQLFQNLISNALKFCGDNAPVVQVSAKSEGGQWRFSVKDQGIGIEPQHFDRIFRLFQRLHTRDEYSGTGLGLAICQKIVERHGGRIWVESSVGHGSTFFFTMPAIPVSELTPMP